MEQERGKPGPSDPDAGVFRGVKVARRFVSPDGMIILVGRSAQDNDTLTLKLAQPQDFWLHVAGDSGSHVVVKNPAQLAHLPRSTQRLAAALAARHSKARRGGQVAVHLTQCAEVRKPHGLPPGKVVLGRYQTVFANPSESDALASGVEESGAR